RLSAGYQLKSTVNPLGDRAVRFHRHLRSGRRVERPVDDNIGTVEGVGERVLIRLNVKLDWILFTALQPRRADTESMTDVRTVLRTHGEVCRVAIGSVVRLVDEW